MYSSVWNVPQTGISSIDTVSSIYTNFVFPSFDFHLSLFHIYFPALCVCPVSICKRAFTQLIVSDDIKCRCATFHHTTFFTWKPYITQWKCSLLDTRLLVPCRLSKCQMIWMSLGFLNVALGEFCVHVLSVLYVSINFSVFFFSFFVFPHSQTLLDWQHDERKVFTLL